MCALSVTPEMEVMELENGPGEMCNNVSSFSRSSLYVISVRAGIARVAARPLAVRGC